jgi:hypothetical protein
MASVSGELKDSASVGSIEKEFNEADKDHDGAFGCDVM